MRNGATWYATANNATITGDNFGRCVQPRVAAGDGRVKLRLKRPLKTGMDEIVLDPFELMRRLAAAVPKPGDSALRVFGFHSALRPQIVRSPGETGRVLPISTATQR